MEAATVQPIAIHLIQKRLRWYGHVRRRYESHTTRSVLDMVVEGVSPRGRPKLRYMDTIKRDIKKNRLTDVNILDSSQGLEIGSFQGNPLTLKSIQGEEINQSHVITCKQKVHILNNQNQLNAAARRTAANAPRHRGCVYVVTCRAGSTSILATLN